jgi:hypothetical protein
MGREQRGARCSCSTVAVRASASSPARPARRRARVAAVDPAHLGDARSVVGRDAARRPFPRSGGQRRRGWIGQLLGAKSTALAVPVGPSALPGCVRAVGDAASARSPRGERRDT